MNIKGASKRTLSQEKSRKFTRKVLLLLMAGVTLGLTRSPRRYFRILKDFRREWKEIGAEPAKLSRTVKGFERRNFVRLNKTSQGYWQVKLTQEGKERARRYQIEDLAITRPLSWDTKWRMVLFDIPESRKTTRNALSHTLKDIGFYQFQKSVFIHAFECRDEIKFITEFFHVSPFVKFATLSAIEGDHILRKYFEV